MNLTALDVYLVSLVGNLGYMFTFAAGLSAVTCVVFLIKYFDVVDYNRDEARGWLKYAVRSATALGLSTFLAAITPSKETAAAMYIIPAVANSELVSKDLPEAGKRLIGVAVKWLEQTTSLDSITDNTDK